MSAESSSAERFDGKLSFRPGERERTIEYCRRALAVDPASMAPARYLLRMAIWTRSGVDEAFSCYRRALGLNPEDSAAHSELILVMDLLGGFGVEIQQEERRCWFARHAQRFSGSIARHRNVIDPERRLRVGYVSADFKSHSAAFIFSPVLRHHDRTAIEVFCYSGVLVEDELTRHFRGLADCWRDAAGMSDDELAGRIREDRIDILVDLSGHTEGNRLLVFARKPAPVQISAWGYSCGTGLDTIDCLFSDSVSIPAEARHLFVERIVDLPCSNCYEFPRGCPDVSVLPALEGQPFTFGYLNRLEKMSDGALSLWARILDAMPDSRLLVKDKRLDDPHLREFMLQRLARRGIPRERLALLGKTSRLDHMKAYQRVDLALDAFPMTGGTSTAEALWMGVPVVTLLGSTVPERGSASALSALDMPDWIARDEDEYLRIAVEMSEDLHHLDRIRQELRPRVAASVVADGDRYTRAVEAAMRGLWRRFCATGSPRPRT